ncbi:unnamed protein product [Ectocarpus sp. 12 AP-2014]
MLLCSSWEPSADLTVRPIASKIEMSRFLDHVFVGEPVLLDVWTRRGVSALGCVTSPSCVADTWEYDRKGLADKVYIPITPGPRTKSSKPAVFSFWGIFFCLVCARCHKSCAFTSACRVFASSA